MDTGALMAETGRSNRWKIALRLGLLGVVAFVLMFAVSFVGATLDLVDTDEHLSDPEAMFILIATPVTFAITIALARAFGLFFPPPQPRVDFKRVVAVGVVGWLAAMLGTWVLSLFMERFQEPFEEQGLVLDILQGGSLAVVVTAGLAIVLLAPLVEELLFRRVLFRSLQVGFGTVPALVASSLIFALVHFNPSGLVIYAWIGAVCAVAYDITGTLAAPVIVHLLNNSLAFTMLMLGPP